MRRKFYIGLGMLSLLGAVQMGRMMAALVVTQPPKNPVEFYLGSSGLIGICLVSAIFCFFPKSHPVTLRIIGFYGLCSCIYILLDCVINHAIVNLPMLFAFWLPGSIYLVWTGKMTA